LLHALISPGNASSLWVLLERAWIPSIPLIQSVVDSFPKFEDPAATELTVLNQAAHPIGNPSSTPVRSLEPK
jgi:hypothetical protein